MTKDIISIRPSRDLRNNYAQISLLAKKNPVAIIVNGREDTAVFCHEDVIFYEIDESNHVVSVLAVKSKVKEKR